MPERLNDVLHADAAGLRLCKIFPGEHLRLCEEVQFAKGRRTVEIILRRASISGRVDVTDDLSALDLWADVMDANGNMIQHVALDAKSFKSLKNHWMRCKYDPDGDPNA